MIKLDIAQVAVHLATLSYVLSTKLQDELPYELKNLVALHEQFQSRERILEVLKALPERPSDEVRQIVGSLASEYRALSDATIETAHSLQSRIEALES